MIFTLSAQAGAGVFSGMHPTGVISEGAISLWLFQNTEVGEFMRSCQIWNMLSVVKVEIGGWACLHLSTDVGEHLWRQELVCIWEKYGRVLGVYQQWLWCRGGFALIFPVWGLCGKLPQKQVVGLLEIRGKQRSENIENISCKTRLLNFLGARIRNHITVCKVELISNEKYHSRWTCFFYSKSLWNSFSHETCCELGRSGRLSFLRIRQNERRYDTTT